jgi:hypothetical protein
VGIGSVPQRTCGQITLENVTKPSKVPGVATYQIHHTYMVDFDSIAGDSGGPVFQFSIVSGYVIGYGTHVHSEDPEDDPTPDAGWYSPINWGWTTYNSLFGITYSVCTTSPC